MRKARVKRKTKMRYTEGMLLFFLAFLLFILFLVSRWVTRLLSRLFMKLFHHQATTIYLLSFIFLPGVVLHEMSHLLFANLLFVPTGEVEFFPEIQGNEVKMGSVAIAKTDPLRRFLIGVAPVLGGIGVMLLASGLLLDSVFSWKSLFLFYIIFQVANTMFSSSKDMEGAVGFLLGLGVLGILLQLVGLPVWAFLVQGVQNGVVVNVVGRINLFLLLALGLDVFITLLFEGIVRLRWRD